MLNPRERHILTERKLKDEPATLEELAQVYGVSRERIRQIEVRAFERVQQAARRPRTAGPRRGRSRLDLGPAAHRLRLRAGTLDR